MGLFGRSKDVPAERRMPTFTHIADYQKRLPKDARKEITASLLPNEPVLVVIPGAWDSALLATDRRVFVYKKGMMGGAFRGSKLAVWDMRQIGGVQIETGRGTGMLAVQPIGAAATNLSTWNDDDRKAPHTLTVERKHFDDARRGVAIIRQLLALPRVQ